MELEEARKQVAEMEVLKARLAQKEKEVEEMNAKNLSMTQDLTVAAGKLAGSEETRRFFMTTGIGEIVAKFRYPGNGKDRLGAGTTPPVLFKQENRRRPRF